jgi:hypothetical protein
MITYGMTMGRAEPEDKGFLKNIHDCAHDSDLNCYLSLFFPAYLKFIGTISLRLQQMIRPLQLNLFERRDLQALFRGHPPEPNVSPLQATRQYV